MTRSVPHTIMAALLALVVATNAVLAVHDFYLRADRYIYAAVDDGEANIAYSIATHGRYAFVASPVLLDQSRLHGQFNYGPFYFFLAAAVTSVFGFSLTIIRSIHLWVIVGAVASAFLWYRGRARIAVPSLFGLAALYFFSEVEWPMVRPDSLVSACAVALVIAAGLAVRRGRARWWFVAGLAAACGAFTHLIAASLVVSAGVLWLSFAAREWHGGIGRARVVRTGVALAIGLVIGAVLFYASFGFDVAMQLRFLAGYREVTATSDGFGAAMLRHFHEAFGFFPAWIQAAVWCTLGLAWVLILGSARMTPSTSAVVREYLLPPALVWTLYFLSNGKYTNYHPGYAVLHHVMSAWTAAAILWVLFHAIEDRPSLSAVISAVAFVAVFVLSFQRVQARGEEPFRAVNGALPVTFSSYSRHVLSPLPARATAWGTVLFGIEAPDRLQLVQQSDATSLMPRIPIEQRAAFAPEFLVLGYPELRDNLLSALRGQGDSYLEATKIVLPAMGYRLVSLTSGSPYGVTRVYARSTRADDLRSRPPSVWAYDAEMGRWYSRVGNPLSVEFRRTAPVRLQIRYAPSPAEGTPAAAMAAELPAGQYLLRVQLAPGAGAVSNRLVAAVSAQALEQEVGELGPRGDFAAYLSNERDVFLLSDHRGGSLVVSQFDRGAGASIASVAASPILDMINEDERPEPSSKMPAVAGWRHDAGVRVTADAGRISVEGDDSSYGYQLASPIVRVQPGVRVELEVPNRVTSGRVCIGVENGDGRWLVRADEWRTRIRFDSPETHGFRIVFANCRDRTTSGRSAFEVLPATYVTRSTTYADRLVEGR